MNRLTFKLVLIISINIFYSCENMMPSAPAEDAILDGPIEGLSSDEHISFISGDEAFGEIFTSIKGLGPVFVSNSCAGCHAGDGKGSPFVGFIRFGQSDTLGNKFLGKGGPQLQHKALPGYKPEELPTGAAFTELIAPAVTGLGFIDAVTDDTLMKIADPDDENNDGISGRLHWNYIPSYVIPRPNGITKNGKYITRFGKKGATYNLLQQTAGAYVEDMGITTTFESNDPYSGLDVDPEVSDNTVNDIVFYLKTLKAPIARNENLTEVIEGKQIFSAINCSSCHIPTLQTGFSPIDPLSFKDFHPYTDLLIHDMGTDLDDGYTEGFALTSEWRTPALWGLGLSKNSQGGEYFLLHDGRAKSIEEAILFHGGEAEQSKQKFLLLSEIDKISLLTFLESL